MNRPVPRRVAPRGRRWLSAWPLLLLAFPGRVAALGPLEGNPFRGRELLSDKLCTQCHSVWGHGGVLGPDLPTAVAGKGWLDLVGEFWNHTPRMIEAVTTRGHEWPTLDRKEMADLLSYLYYLRLFDESGDASRGAASYSQLGCSNCHRLGGKGGGLAGPLDKYSAYPSPVMLAQAMWNAGPAMQQAQLGHRNPIPRFSRGEMANIQAFIRSRGLRPNRSVELLPLPDPSRGSAIFREKRCIICHPPGGSEGPDLRRSGLNMTVSEISGTLWNHSYAMNDRMLARGIQFPHFKDTEMADLISYLYFLGFFGEQGDPTRGASVFTERGCVQCHEERAGKAPNLSTSKVAADPIALSAAMWNHSPQMHQLMAERAVAWPKFDVGDMGDLAAYLRRSAAAESVKKRQRRAGPSDRHRRRAGGTRAWLHGLR